MNREPLKAKLKASITAAAPFSGRIKLIGRSCTGISEPGELDPPGAAPSCPSDKVACTPCWARCSSAIREEEFGMRVTDPVGSTTIVSPGSSATMTLPSLVTISNVPCAKSLYVMVPSSRNASCRLAAWASFMVAKVNAASVRMPIPRSCAVPRILATGVSMLRPPVVATLPATKVKAPWIRLNRADSGCRSGRTQIRSAPSAPWRKD